MPATDIASLSGALLENVIIGAALGFGTRLLFSAVESAGSLIDLFGGFSLAFALDPFNNNNNSVFGRFYALLTTTLLFASQAHQVVIAGFLRTFQTLPLTGHLDLARLDAQLVPGLSQAVRRRAADRRPADRRCWSWPTSRWACSTGSRRS